jgi:hypothetical protein
VIEPQLAHQTTGAEDVNCCVKPCGVVAATGDIVTGDTTVTFTDPVLPSLVAFAVIVQVPGYSAARYSPAEEMPPHEAVHVALALAVNWSVAFSFIVWLEPGEIVTDAAATPLAIKQGIKKTLRRRAFADMMLAPRKKSCKHSTASWCQR